MTAISSVEQRRLDWNWSEATRGAVCAVPGVIIAATGNVGAGLFCAMGVLPVAMLGVPPARRMRPRLVLVGIEFGIAYFLGSVIGQVPVLAVAVLVVAAFGAVVLAADVKTARMLPALLVPGFVLGMNEPPSTGLALAGVFALGSVWATAVTWCWPAVLADDDAVPPLVASAPMRKPSAATVLYACAFSAAASIGLTIGFLLDWSHVAWIAASAMFIMRPLPDVSRARALQRTLATFAGVLLAGLLQQLDLTGVALGVIAGLAIAAIIATRSSVWYVAPAGTALVVLLLSGTSGTEEFRVTFHDRILETAIGAALALLATAVLLVIRRRYGSASTSSG